MPTLVVWLGATAVLTTGCGPSQKKDANRTAVSGLVTLDDKPLPGGTVLFESTTGSLGKSVAIREAGKYLTDRAPIGPVRIAIETESLQYGRPKLYVKIPAKYADTATSGLTAEIKQGENENVDFALKSAP